MKININPKRTSLLLLLIFPFLFLSGCRKAPDNAKYVFLFIGDGMGLSQIHATQMFLGVTTDKSIAIKKLVFTQFPSQGFMMTHASDTFITDSAASATAMATGRKTLNAHVGMDEQQKISYRNISEAAREAGIKVGFVSNVSLDHATPACFYAHSPLRSSYYEISLSMAQSPYNFFGGGGILQPKGPEGDKPDVLEKARQNGFQVITTRKGFNSLKHGEDKVIVFNEILTDDGAMLFEIDRAEDDLPLSAFVRKAGDVLMNPHGFFIMAEGGKIDWACHDNDAATTIAGVIAFDKAIQEAVEFYRKHPTETLIIVTADHETGGLTLRSDDPAYPTSIELLTHQNISIDLFNKRIAKPYWKSTEKFHRNLEDLLPALEKHFGLCFLPTDAKQSLRIPAKTGDPAAKQKLALSLSKIELEALKKTLKTPKSWNLGFVAAKILDNKAGISWATTSHSGSPVPVFALGKGAELFNSYFDNTEIAAKLAKAMGISLH